MSCDEHSGDPSSNDDIDHYNYVQVMMSGRYIVNYINAGLGSSFNVQLPSGLLCQDQA